MFGKPKKDAGTSEPEVELTAELHSLIATAADQQDAKHALALERGIGAGGEWSADLAAGTISFNANGQSLTGPVQFIGSYSPSTQTWLWGWANAAMPEHVTSAVVEAAGYGLANDVSALTTPKLHRVDAGLADELAAVAIHLSGAGTLYRGQGGAAVAYLAFGDLS